MPQVEEAPVPPRPHRPEQGDPHLRRRFRRSHGDSEGGRSRRPGAGATARDDQTAVEGVDDRGGPVTQTELHQDPREVLGHGVLGDGELGGDLVVPQAAADRGEHLTLLMTELGRGGAEERGGAWSVGGEGRRHRCSPGSGGVGLAGAVDKVFGGEPGKASGTIRSDIRGRVSLPGACRQRTPGPTRWTVPVIKGERTGGSPSRWTSAATPATRALCTSASTDSAGGTVPGTSSPDRRTVRVSRRCPTVSAATARRSAGSARSWPTGVGESSSAQARSAIRLSRCPSESCTSAAILVRSRSPARSWGRGPPRRRTTEASAVADHVQCMDSGRIEGHGVLRRAVEEQHSGGCGEPVDQPSDSLAAPAVRAADPDQGA